MQGRLIAALLTVLVVGTASGCERRTTSQANPSSNSLKQRLAGTTWLQPDGHKITLNADGTMRHSNPDYNGTWDPAGERKILIQFKNGFVSVWTFDQGLTNFTGGHYKPDADQQGKRDKAASQP